MELELGKMAIVDKAETDRESLIRDLPEEVWDNFLRGLDYDTLKNVLNSSPFFRELWSSKLTTLLFGEVWPVLKEYLVEEEETPDVIRKCTSCGKTRDIGTFEDYWILNARGVCKTWCKTIDSGYEFDQKSESTSGFSKQFSKSESAREFLQHFEASHNDYGESGRSPFVGGSIELQLRVLEETPFVTEMLQKYGRHVKDCLIIDSENITFEFYSELVQWSSLMPNLADLKLDFLEVYDDDMQLTEAVGNNPMYQFANLQHLHLSGTPHEVFAEIISKNSHVQKLTIDLINSPEKVNMAVFEQLNLNELVIHVMEVEQYDMLRALNTSPRLKIFELQVHLFYVSWEQLFGMIEEKWGDTLEEVKLRLPIAENDDDETALMQSSPSMRLNLPNVKKLDIKLKNVTSLDFILPMKENLEVLNIELDYTINDVATLNMIRYLVNSQVLLLLDYQFRFYESNVWARFAKLKEVVFEMNIGLSNELLQNDTEIPEWIQRSERAKVYRRSTWQKWLRGEEI